MSEQVEALRAECERLRVQVSALQSDANSWQSGYDKGREDGAKSAEAWKAQHARDSAELRKLCAERDALAAELTRWGRRYQDVHEPALREAHAYIQELRAALEAIKGQQPVAFYWQDVGYPEPRKHGPYFGWPSESALRNVDGRAMPMPLYASPQPDPDVRALVEALEECAASLAWNCFGECRAVHAGPIMPAAKALDTARTALAAQRQAQQGDSHDA
ncbi:MAG: hypothetical protein U1D65_12910 [Pseudomonas sp.]|nr:hypothetical protein [Pseudomonas sp.]MDZ4192901.1 hypothetical protein [Pseudomonas sp.]